MFEQKDEEKKVEEKKVDSKFNTGHKLRTNMFESNNNDEPQFKPMVKKPTQTTTKKLNTDMFNGSKDDAPTFKPRPREQTFAPIPLPKPNTGPLEDNTEVSKSTVTTNPKFNTGHKLRTNMFENKDEETKVVEKQVDSKFNTGHKLRTNMFENNNDDAKPAEIKIHKTHQPLKNTGMFEPNNQTNQDSA